VAGRAAPEPFAFDATNGVSPDGDPFPTGAESGTITTQPEASAERLAHPGLSWQGGPRGFDRPLDSAFVRVQRQVTVKVKEKAKKRKRPRRRGRRRGGRREPSFTGKLRAAKTVKRWRTVDSDLRLNILWTVDDDGVYSAHWEVPLDAPKGTYRFVVRANRYALTSSTFKVVPSGALTAVPVNAEAGHVAVELRYPAAEARQGLNDPPGDFAADLTFRPAVVPSGIATFVVDGREVRVSEGAGGVFAVPAPAGAKVELNQGAATDEFGNANGNALTLSP
jgi:hypothetical protein